MSTFKSQEEYYEDLLRDWKDRDFIEVKTSGSTGNPKLIKLYKNHLIRSAQRTNSFFNIMSDSRLHSSMSFKHIGGIMMAIRSFVAKCKLSWDEPSLQPVIPENRIDLISLVPAQMIHVLDNIDKYCNISNIIIGGSAINPALLKRIVDSPFRCWESYGMTETASHIALRALKFDENDDLQPFSPLEGIAVWLTGEECLAIEDKEVRVITNDIAEIFEDGSFQILGRKDHMIITGGRKVLPLTIENVLHKYAEGYENGFYIDSVPDELWTSKIVLVTEPGLKEYPAAAMQMRQIIDSIPENELPNWMRPKEIILVEKIEKTDNNKLKRNNLTNLKILYRF